MVTPAVVIILTVLVRLSHGQITTTVATTNSVSTTTAIVQGTNVPIASLLQQTTVTTIFYNYWSASNIQNTLAAGATYTLFVPINSAWNRLASSDQTTISACLTGSCGSSLLTLIKYHMFVGSYTSAQFSSAATQSSGGPCTTSFGADASTMKCFTWATQTGGAQTHVALTSISGSWYINGARIVLADQVATNFVVHFIDKWLYPVDPGITAQSYLYTAGVSSTGLIPTSCSTCSPTFATAWTQVSSGAVPNFFNWAQNTAGSSSAGVTMLIPYSQALSSVYSINTLASMIAAANVSALAYVTAVHVIPNHVLFLAPWVANGASAYSCGPADVSTMTQYVQSCDLTYFNSSTWSIEVGRTGATIVYPDIPVENGVVHIISNVLNYVYGNLWTIIQIHPLLTKFKALVLADTTNTLMGILQSTTAQYTVFAPDDNSFTSAIQNTLTQNVSLLVSTLELGILQTSILYSSIQGLITVANPTVWSNVGLAGYKLRFTANINGTEVDGGRSTGFIGTYVTQADLGANNGILHVVTGGVFGMPQLTVAQYLLSRYDLSTSANYFGQLTDAWNLFTNNAGPFTVFAPTNQAWITLSLNLPAIRSGTTMLLNVLMRHYTGSNTTLYGNSMLSTTSAQITAQTLGGSVTFIVVSTNPPQYQVTYASSSTSVTASVTVSDFACTNGRVHIINTVLAVPSDVLSVAPSCQNPYTCAATSIFLNPVLLVLGIIFGLVNRQ